jgi:hypothetical protein
MSEDTVPATEATNSTTTSPKKKAPAKKKAAPKKKATPKKATPKKATPPAIFFSPMERPSPLVAVDEEGEFVTLRDILRADDWHEGIEMVDENGDYHGDAVIEKLGEIMVVTELSTKGVMAGKIAIRLSGSAVEETLLRLDPYGRGWALWTKALLAIQRYHLNNPNQNRGGSFLHREPSESFIIESLILGPRPQIEEILAERTAKADARKARFKSARENKKSWGQKKEAPVSKPSVEAGESSAPI